MLRIILCDDDLVCLNRIQGIVEETLQKNGIKNEIHAFARKDNVSNYIMTSCDVAILDIDFETSEYNGIDIAREIRQKNPDAVIIFATNYIEFAPEGYEVQAFRYILKNELDAKLSTYLKQAINAYRNRRQTYKFRSEGEIVEVFVNDILYVEAQLHMVRLVCSQKKREYRFYSSMKALEEELTQLGFLRSHKSYLVNMVHIKKFNSSGIELSNGVQLPVGEKKYADQKQLYLLWKGKQSWKM